MQLTCNTWNRRLELRRGLVVRDGAYLAARWPGDAHRFAEALARMIAAGA